MQLDAPVSPDHDEIRRVERLVRKPQLHGLIRPRDDLARVLHPVQIPGIAGLGLVHGVGLVRAAIPGKAGLAEKLRLGQRAGAGLYRLEKFPVLFGAHCSTPNARKLASCSSSGVSVISFFIGAVICIQIKLNIESPWMPRFVVGYTTREILLLEFSSSIMCLILAGKVGSNIASEIGTMRVTQQIDALEIMGVNSASYLILPKILGLMTMIPFLVIFSIFAGVIGAFCTAWFAGIMNATDLEYGLQYCFVEWYIWCSFIKSLFFAFIIASVSAYFGYTVEGGSIAVGKASTDSVVSSSVLILFSDLILTQLLMG